MESNVSYQIVILDETKGQEKKNILYTVMYWMSIIIFFFSTTVLYICKNYVRNKTKATK